MKIFVSCAKGLESLLIEELRGFAIGDCKETVAGVFVEGEPEAIVAIGLHSRFASRVLLPLAEADIASVDDFYDLVRSVGFKDWLKDVDSFVVDVSGHHYLFKDTRFAALKAKDAIVDSYRYAGMERPSIDRENPGLRLFVRLSKKKVSVGVDAYGASLHRRGHRLSQGVAPIKEPIAAAMLKRAGWPSDEFDALVDPFCGSGTLLLEGLDMAFERPPGIARDVDYLSRLPWGLDQIWEHEQAEAEQRFQDTLSSKSIKCLASDSGSNALEAGKENVRHAGYEDFVEFVQRPIDQWKNQPAQGGRALVVANPPYGKRIGDMDQLCQVYADLGEALENVWHGGRGAVITSEALLGRSIGIEADKKYRLYNGALECELYLFKTLGADPRKARQNKPVELSDAAKSFQNRLQKNLKHLRKWAKRQGYEAYRVYDADIPEYNVAIDLYGEHVFLQEYAPPKTVDAAVSNRRFKEVRHVLSQLDATKDFPVHIRRRERQKGDQQYTKRADKGKRLVVKEGQLKFQVNLDDYLDTGLFLDHRPIREWIGENSKGKRVLNLFSYTGSVSVYAAAGGASFITSVDLSQTYLNWAQDNFAENGFDPEGYVFLRADCTAWLASAKAKFDLIFIDPPSFSNSKRMEDTFDVQRDHLTLIEKAMELLNPGGEVIFSNNKRGFKLAPEIEANYQVEDWTAKSMPEDFKRKGNAHKCWRIRVAE